MSASVQPAARRLSGGAMLRMMFRQRVDLEIQSRDDALPFGWDSVLHTVADMVARAEEPGVLQPAASLGPMGLARLVVHRRRYSSSVAETQCRLEALAAAGMIVLSPTGAVSLPVALPAEEGPRRVSRSPGRRKEWMTDEQWGEHVAANSAAWAAQERLDKLEAQRPAQTAMLMPIQGGRAVADIRPDISTGTISDGISGTGSADISAFAREVGGGGGTRESILTVPPPPTAAHEADLGCDIPADISNGFISALVDNSGVTGITRDETQPAADVEQMPSRPPAGAATAEAERRAGEIVRRLDLPPKRAAGLGLQVEQWLQAVAGGGALLDAAMAEAFAWHDKERAAGKPGVASAQMIGTIYERMVKQQGEHARLVALPGRSIDGGPTDATTATPADAAPVWSTDPRLQLHPAWAAASAPHKRSLLAIIDLVESDQPATEISRVLHARWTYSRDVFDLVGRHRPEIYDIIDKEPPDGVEVEEHATG